MAYSPAWAATAAAATLAASVPGMVVDNFAGGGGASTGIEQALGRAVDMSRALVAANFPVSVPEEAEVRRAA